MPQWLIVNGSPRVNGSSARVVKLLSALIADRRPDVALSAFEVGTCDVLGCNGCDYCRTDDECIMSDDMTDLLDTLEAAERVILVTPIYFAGLPSQTKAVLDRLQPLYWRYREREEAGVPQPPKRPLSLFVLGDGGDPHGYDPLVATVRSAFAVARFEVAATVPLVGVKRIKASDLEPWAQEVLDG